MWSQWARNFLRTVVKGRSEMGNSRGEEEQEKTATWRESF